MQVKDKLTHLVGPIRGVIEHGLEEVSNSGKKIYGGDRARHNQLVYICNKEATSREIGSDAVEYMNPAIEDFWFIGKGAINFTTIKGNERSAARDLVLRSIPALCLPACMPDSDGEWIGTQRSWSGTYDVTELFIPETKFEFTGEGEEKSISYTSDARTEIESYTTPYSGCPAHGPILEKMFAKYIETIFVG